MEGDRPNSAKNESARTPPATVIHTSCVLWRQPPNIVGHKIEDCPIIMQYVLRFSRFFGQSTAKWICESYYGASTITITNS